MSVSKTYFERSALTVFIISSFGSLLNMGFQYISLKALSVSEFGDLNTLLSISTVVSTIATVASLDAVRVTSSFWADNSREKKERKESVFQYITGVVPIFLVAVTILFILSYLLRESLNQFFNISDNRLIPLAVISGGINIFSATARYATVCCGIRNQQYYLCSKATPVCRALQLRIWCRERIDCIAGRKSAFMSTLFISYRQGDSRTKERALVLLKTSVCRVFWWAVCNTTGPLSYFQYRHAGRELLF